MSNKSEWAVIIDLLKKTDHELLTRISRKMVNFLYLKGIKEAKELLEHFSPVYKEDIELLKEQNRPHQIKSISYIPSISNKIFGTANKYMSEKDVVKKIQKFIKEENSGFLVRILENPDSSIGEISDAIDRYEHLASKTMSLTAPREISVRVALIRTFLSDQADFIEIAKKSVRVKDFSQLIKRIISPYGGKGKCGGKCSGMFLAIQILRNSNKYQDVFAKIKIPNTWHLTSDGIFRFMRFNNLENIIYQKYKDIDQVRQEYPYIIQTFKNSAFPQEIINGLSRVLDNIGDKPLIIRSSSMLEDRIGTSFAGKYKSLFIANQGSKEKRLIELMDAIAEVYASTFGPDPIEYRINNGLVDFHEEMGIMVQEVIGKKVGPYFFPAFAGVAFSHNEFLWSKRVKREDGIVRMVPGLGTRAVDRLDNDYPVLIAPGQPGLRVNVSNKEIISYSPKNIDVVNLETQVFETIEIRELLSKYGNEYPEIKKIVSIVNNDLISIPGIRKIDFTKEKFVVNFEGLFKNTDFIKETSEILDELQKAYKYPIDIEFAHDGINFYLLQCRSQSSNPDNIPVIIPTDIPENKIMFTANKYISNGIISDINYIVYVDPQKYSKLPDREQYLAVGRAVGKLNKILPKREFILMGPGRWGSRGDIKLGVDVTYSDINNTLMLIEMAIKKKDYLPDLSFGTHFFQDLVESNIRYLPLYPDKPDTNFNKDFFSSGNILSEILPDYAHLAGVINVIDVRKISGNCMTILMDGNSGQAVAYFDSKLSEKVN